MLHQHVSVGRIGLQSNLAPNLVEKIVESLKENHVKLSCQDRRQSQDFSTTVHSSQIVAKQFLLPTGWETLRYDRDHVVKPGWLTHSVYMRWSSLREDASVHLKQKTIS